MIENGLNPLEYWFINLEQTTLNQYQSLLVPYKSKEDFPSECLNVSY